MHEKSLIKVLTDAGLGSRRKMADAIRDGRVEVSGVIAESFNHPVDTDIDRVFFDGQRVKIKPEETICLALHKTSGVVSTLKDEKNRPTVLDILPEKFQKLHLYPVGRLDIDTTGLILLTNDGNLTNRLTHPRYEIEKEYYVQIDGSLKPDEIYTLKHGVLLEDGITAPAKVRKINSLPYNYSVIIHEGRKRQVRRMFEHLGHPVKSLQRVRIGTVSLGNLAPGAVRLLTPLEIKNLYLSSDSKTNFSNRSSL